MLESIFYPTFFIKAVVPALKFCIKIFCQLICEILLSLNIAVSDIIYYIKINGSKGEINMFKFRQRTRIFFKKARRTEAEIEEHVWEIESESPVGFRTIKTALSIFICLLLFSFLDRFPFFDTSDAFLACVTAIICMKDSVNESVKIGAARLTGTFVGAVLGLLYLYVSIFLHNQLISILLISLCIILLITICNKLNSPQAIVICCVVFLFISMDQGNIDPAVHSAKRFTDTAIGLIISFLINRFLFRPEKKPEMLENADSDAGADPDADPDTSENKESADEGTSLKSQ